ncbi:unnamed protein product [Zymoseptoria tritici ST99CH_3D1]|nr:unnamed protein product [Zymoseptoria tritici ST99CH_3D1]
MSLSFNDTLGDPIPADTPHAVSVSLPTWKANVGYEEGESWVVDKMQTGYPRFFIHKSIQKLASSIVAAHGSPDTEKAMLLPSSRCAARCLDFIRKYSPKTVDTSSARALNFIPHPDKLPATDDKKILPRLSAVIYPQESWPAAKSFWQHSGEGISSRRAEFCQRAFDDHFLVEQSSVCQPSMPRVAKGPRRYQKQTSVDITPVNGNGNGDANGKPSTSTGEALQDTTEFVEARFGRNLDTTFAAQAKLAIRKRIAGSLTTDVDLPQSLDEPSDLVRSRTRDLPNFSVDDVYLFSCGMNAIFTSHQSLMRARGPDTCIMYGFPYVDTLKVLEKFGPGALFYGYGNADDINALEKRLKRGERFLALYCEFPGNPLLKSPDLKRLRALADTYSFAIVIDETIGNFLNVHVLPYADIVVSSLTKIFSGDSNVMGGAMILNPQGKFYRLLKTDLANEYEDNHFEEDSMYLERNSRDFVDRIKRINTNAEAIADVLRASSKVKQLNYPKYSETREFYDACRVTNGGAATNGADATNGGAQAWEGGYGGLLSATFHSVEDAALFYDALETAKGPSLGTNFTLSSPFVLLAHYSELEWAKQYGCDVSLVRFSVGLEDTEELVQVFEKALRAIPG